MYNMPMDAMILAGCTPETVGQAGRFGDCDDDEEDLDVVETVKTVYTIIAEHLIGEHAFRAAAYLNVASRAIHRETSPVLWESVFLDHRNYHQWPETLPVNLRYTKYFFLQSQGLPNAFLTAAPNLVLAITVATPLVNPICILSIHRPVSLSTTLTLLQTPIHHPQANHANCARAEAACSRGYGKGGLAGLQRICLGTERKPCVRPAEAVSRVDITNGAYIHGYGPERLRGTTTGVRLNQASVEYWPPRGHDRTGQVATAVELLRVAALQETPVDVRGGTQVDESRCLYRRMIEVDSELSFDPSEDEADAFVCKLRYEARRAPLILQNKIFLAVRGDVAAGYVSSLGQRMRRIYESTITSPREVPPILPDGYAEVFDCRAEVKLEPWEKREDGRPTRVEVASVIAVVEGDGVKFHCRYDER